MNKRQKMMRNRIVISSIALLLTFIFNVREMGVAGLLIYLAIYFYIGWDVLLKSAKNISNGQVFDENFLMSIATIGAFVIKEYPEAVAVLLFYQIGELFQSYAVGKSRESIAELMDIRPDYANIEKDGELIEVDPYDVQIGDIIVVRPGEKIPLDGVVIDGNSTLNTSALTGESVPLDVNTGENVVSGSINISGLIKVRVEKVFEESTVTKILELVENSSSKKAKTERFITKFAKYYTPGVVFGAIALFLIPTLFFGEQWNIWFERALIFLVISCPCALVVSVPMSFFGGIGGASRSGILVKGSNYLEILSETEIIVFDKTGTLTKGTFDVTALHPESIDENELLEMAVLAENYSNHPISQSLKNAYKKTVDSSRVGEYEEIIGHGIKAEVDGKIVLAGNDKLMIAEGIDWHDCHLTGTIIHVAVDGEYAGHIVISDEVKPDSKEAIAKLKSLGIKKTVMLTGDKANVGEQVAKELGIDEVYTELLPADKVEIVEKLLTETSKRGKLAFVGDGINDAPVLTRADIGIAMGGHGSDAAIEAADIVLMNDEPSKIGTAFNISKRTLGIAKQNIVFALVIKFAALLLGAMGIANMQMAIFADVGVTILATMNASRALQVVDK
ncbi:MAG: cadmium-translocating P-type ATPase [Tissierellia bacterium]|nr:cadmium-translocating P-type ATPase [Tissierellia bacterium]